MQPLQQPLVQCLDLSRPDSISTAGYCADVAAHATRYPQPMLYSPAKGALVTYEPSGRTGIQEQQLLQALSRPKQVTAKSFKSQHSPQQQQQQDPGAADAQQQLPAHQQHPSAEPYQQDSHLSGLTPEAAAAVERSTAKGQRAAAEAAFTAGCQTERQLVSYPQAFSWGGRVKGKHSSLCRMHAGAHAAGGSGVLQQPAAASSSSAGSAVHQVADGSKVADSLCCESSQPPCADMQQHPSPAAAGPSHPQAGSLNVRASRAVAAEAEVAAAAVQLGARADRLLNLLERRTQKQQQQQQQGRGPGAGGSRQQRAVQQGRQQKHGAGWLGTEAGAGLDSSVQDEPLRRAGLDYLQL